MNKTKRFLCVFFCFIFVCLSFAPSGTVVAKKGENYLDWKQQDDRWGNIKVSSKTVSSVGCTTVSMAILLMHSGIMKDNFTPKKFVTDYKKAGGYDGNCFKWGVIDSYTNGNFKYKGDTGEGSSVSKIKELYDKGYYVLICMHNNGAGSGTHWIALIDGSSTDPDKIIVADPGYPQKTKTLSEARSSSKNTGNNLRFVYYECKKSKANERDTSGGTVGDGSSNKKDEDKKIETVTDGSNKVNLGNGKWGLVDPVSGELYELSDDSVPLMESGDLSNDQLKGVVDWKNNIDYIHGGGVIKYIRIFVNLVGILFLVWMVLIYMSYWYDRINNFIDIELLPIVTAGQLKVSPEEDNCTFRPKGLIKGAQQTVNHRAVLGICFIGIGFAVLLISGKIYDLLAYFTLGIKKLLRI